MPTYSLFTASYGSNYANLRVRVLEQVTGSPAVIMAGSTSGVLSVHGNAMTDSSGNLSVYLDASKTFQVFTTQFVQMPSQISIAQEIQRTITQLSAAPTLADIGLGPGATFYLDTNPAAQYRISADKASYISVSSTGGGGGGGSFSTITGLPSDNTNLSVALNNKIGTPVGYLAATNSPVLTSGIAPTNGNVTYVVQDAGVVAMAAAIQNDIPFVRNGDTIVWSAALGKWIRFAGVPFSIPISSAIVLNDAHNDCTLICSSNPTISLGTSRMAGFGVIFLGAYTLSLTSVSVTDARRSVGDASGYSFINQTTDTSTYRQDGSKL